MKRIRTNRTLHFQIILLLLLQLFFVLKGKAAGDTHLPVHNFSTGSISGLLWIDRDGDGWRDAGEPGYEGAVVVLIDPNGLLLATTSTDALGNYSFTNVDAGLTGKSYQVWFRVPDGYRFSPRTGAINDASNSDVSEATGKTPVFTLLPGEAITTIDAGLLTAANGTLPLHTLELTALLSGSVVNLKWVAENEMNTTQFVVQRSVDGSNYTDIANVAVSGQTNTPTEYHLSSSIQPLLSYNIVYYRIKAEDVTQRSAFSNVAPIRLSKISGIRVWPNPFVNELRITYNGAANSAVDVQVTDNAGKTVWNGTFQVSRGLNQLSIGGMDVLSSGIYFVRVVDKQTQQSFVERVAR